MAAESGKWANVGLWVVSGLLGLLYIFAGGTKLAGMEPHIEHFAKWGYPDWFRLVVGAVEFFSGVFLLIPKTALYAASALLVVMVGAVFTELTRGEPPRAAFPFVLFLLLGGVAYFRRKATRKGHEAPPAKA